MNLLKLYFLNPVNLRGVSVMNKRLLLKLYSLTLVDLEGGVRDPRCASIGTGYLQEGHGSKARTPSEHLTPH